MNAKKLACAPEDIDIHELWSKIDWDKCERFVQKLQARIVKAKSSTSDRNFPADRGVCDRASGDVWCGKIAVCIPEAGRACCGTDRDCNLPVGIERQNCNKCVTGL